MQYCKLQICCLIIALFVALIYGVQNIKYRRQVKFSIFDALLAVGIFCLIFDGLTAYTVNHTADINTGLNLALHGIFLLSLDCVVFILFLYVLSTTGGFPRHAAIRALIFAPFAANVIAVLCGTPFLEFIEGEYSNYSMGLSAYTCFAMVAIYTLMSVIVFIKRRRQLGRQTKVKVAGYLSLILAVAVFQSIFPQALITSIAVTGLILGAYLCQEDPAVRELERNHSEMVTGFAALIESRDESTGGHVRRTTAYVKLIVKGLLERREYQKELTAEYVKNLLMAAPLHDVGKISVPDAVLQKPGKLTDEEFEIIKTHAAEGGRIIQETFGKTVNREYCAIAYEVARHHHEKWNGRGYPDGLKGEDIPLCARIMAVADVFDAVSQKRCYRDALPAEECFKIIEEGSGRDFEPLLVEIFTAKRAEAEEILHSFNEE